MESISSIIVIVLVIVASVAGISYTQKKEQARAEIARQVAKYKYRANEAALILENFAQIPIGVEARKLLLQYAELNLAAASKLKTADHILNNNLSSVRTQLQNPNSPIDSQMLNIPNDPKKLNLILKNLTTLGKYLQKFQNINSLNSASIPIAVNKLNLLIAEAKISAFVKQAKMSLARRDYVNAQRNFQIAQNMLNRFPKKNNRLIKLEAEIIQQSKQKPKVEPPKTTQSPDESKTKESKHIEDDIFGPKKKW